MLHMELVDFLICVIKGFILNLKFNLQLPAKPTRCPYTVITQLCSHIREKGILLIFLCNDAAVLRNVESFDLT